MVGAVRSLVDAAQRVVSTASYVILVAMATSFSLRVAAVLVSRRLAVLTPAPPRRPDQSARVNDNDVMDDVSDDDDENFRCRCDVTERSGETAAPVKTRQSAALLHSLKYYETNV